jgi:hypothetical protein
MRTSIESRADPLEADRASPADAQGRLSQRLSELQLLSSRDLRTEWRRLLRTNPPSLSRDLLVRALAYRVQELAHGGLPKASARKLATLAAELGRDGPISTEARPRIKPGARLVREWRGRTHVVTATQDGFAYAGKAYPSLTGIARAITGARWSGPRFFGLVKRPAESGKTRLHLAVSEAGHDQA